MQLHAKWNNAERNDCKAQAAVWTGTGTIALPDNLNAPIMSARRAVAHLRATALRLMSGR